MKETLWGRWNKIADNDPAQEAIVWVRMGEEPKRWTYEDLITTAERISIWLIDKGVRQGDVCAILLRHHPYLFPLYMALEAICAIPTVLAYPNQRLHPDKFREGMQGMAKKSGLKWLLIEKDLEPTLKSLALGEEGGVKGFLFPFEFQFSNNEHKVSQLQEIILETTDPHQACLLQHSSGTTGLQKGVVLSHQAVLEHVETYAKSIGLSVQDKVVSWLPLYHDMGLIASFHMPLASGITSVQLDPFEWVQVPVLLFEQIAREVGTLTWLPNFAYNLMADRIHEEDLEGLTLDSLRMVINCSEPVRADSHKKFLRRFSPYGLRASSLAACYAMAETTFAVSQTVPGRRATELLADRDELARGVFEQSSRESRSREIVSSGCLIEGTEVRIVDCEGESLGQGRVGEILVRSKTLFDGYVNQPEKTAKVMRGGWYCSGDLGFLLNDEIFVIGRTKDLIIIAGKNVYPEDIEDVVSNVSGVIPGRVVAVGEDDLELGTERIAVIAETREGTNIDKEDLRRQVIEACMKIDITISRVYLVPPRWLIKSSSGKPSRRANKERVTFLEAGCYDNR